MSKGPSQVTKAVRAIMSLVRKTDGRADVRYFASVAEAICDELNCNIVMRPSNDRHFRAQAQTFSRILNVKVVWPKKKSFAKVEHWIVFDGRMPPASAARCIAHELYHILAHDPTGGKRDVDKKTGFVQYTDLEEKAADIFSLAILKNRQYVKSRSVPLTSRELLRLLKDEAGKPSHMTWEEIEGIVDDLEL